MKRGRKEYFVILCLMILPLVLAISCGGDEVDTAVNKVATPTFNPPGGSHYKGTMNVNISCTTTNATIKYTIDGTNPTTSATATIGTSVSNITTGTIIRAYAFNQEITDSEIATANYVIYPSIQAAINVASPGAVITIPAGVYNEQLIITNSLTLVGAGSSTVFSISYSTMTNTNKFKIFSSLPDGVSRPTAAFIIADRVYSGKSVTIKNIKLDGTGIEDRTIGGSVTRFYGILYRNSDGVIDGVTIDGGGSTGGENMNDNIFAQSITNIPGVSVEIKNCNLWGYFKNAITCNYAGITANIHNNTATGGGPHPISAQNGLQIGWGGTGSINNNIVNGGVYVGSTWTASGILFFDTTGTVTAEGNTITGCETALCVAMYPASGWSDYIATSTTVNIKNNTIDCSGIPVANVSGIMLDLWGNAVNSATIIATIENNKLIGGGSSTAGIWITKSSTVGDTGTVSATISNNNIYGWLQGIWVFHGDGNIQITYNTITNNGTYSTNAGVKIGGNATIPINNITNIHVNYNNIKGNIGYGICNLDIAGTLDAVNNYWGSATGPTHTSNPSGTGDPVSDYVTYTPYSTTQY